MYWKRVLFCAPWLALAVSQAVGAQTLTLTQALEGARANLDVAIARGGLAAARADILAANHAPLPVLSGKLSSIDLDKGIGSGHLLKKKIDKGIGIDFVWERGDKRQWRTRAAQQTAAAAEADLHEVLAQQLIATTAAFYDLLAAQERHALVEALAEDARQLATTAARRVKAGDLAAQDALRIEIEAERAQSDALAARMERQRVALALGQLTGQGAQADGLAVTGAWPMAPELADADVPTLVQQRADVRAAALRVQAAQAAVDAARAMKKSDVTWGVSYDHYPSTSTALIELRAQMPLQWGYGYQGEMARALALLRQAEDTQEKTVRAATAEVQRLRLETANGLARARRTDQDVMPRARQVAQTAEAAYQKGALSLTDLLEARRTLRAVMLDAVSTRAEAAKAVGAWQWRLAPPDLPPSTSLESKL